MEKKIIVFVLIIALVLRIISLNQSLWLDEAIGAIAVHDYSYIGIVTDFIKGDTHPPLYYLTLKFWTNIFGYSEVAMRMLSVLFGVATVYVVYLIARFKIQDLGFKKENLFPILAPLLMATAPLHVYYSQEVRMYAMNTLLVSLVVLFYLKNDWWKYSITLLLLGMSDYLPLLILPALWLYAFLENKDQNWWKNFVISHLLLVFFLIVWFPTFLIQSEGSRIALALFSGWGELIGKAGIKELALVWIKFLIGRISFDEKLIYGCVVILISILAGFPFIKSAMELRKTKLLWFWLIIPISLTFLGAIFVPGFSYFRMIIVLPAFYLLIAYGLTKIGSRTLTTIIIYSNIAFSLLYLFNPAHHREDWKKAVSYVHSSIKNDEIVLQAFPQTFAGYRWYANQGINVIPSYGATKKLGASDEDIKLRTHDLLQGVHGVYYFNYLDEQTDPRSIIKQTLEENKFTERTARDFRGVGIVEYWERGGS